MAKQIYDTKKDLAKLSKATLEVLGGEFEEDRSHDDLAWLIAIKLHSQKAGMLPGSSFVETLFDDLDKGIEIYTRRIKTLDSNYMRDMLLNEFDLYQTTGEYPASIGMYFEGSSADAEKLDDRLASELKKLAAAKRGTQEEFLEALEEYKTNISRLRNEMTGQRASMLGDGDSRDINFFFGDIKDQMRDDDYIEIHFSDGSVTIKKEDIPQNDRIKYNVTPGVGKRKILRKKKVYITDIRYMRFPYEIPGNIIRATEQQIDDINNRIVKLPAGIPGVVIKLNQAQDKLRFEVDQSYKLIQS